MSAHLFLRFKPRNDSRSLRDIALTLMNYYCKSDLSRNRWSKERPRIVIWLQHGKDAASPMIQRKSLPITLAILESNLGSGEFDNDALGLDSPRCIWLDREVNFSMDLHHVDDSGKTVSVRTPTVFGDSFPIIPEIDREGALFSSFQGLLLSKILFLKNRLVENSALAIQLEWFDDLRLLVTDCISLVDSTLHQLYLMAQYAPLPGWTFDAAKLGSRYGRRLKDKLSWVGTISGTPLNPHPQEMEAFERIKNLRNHLHHFDPPCFGYTLEDAVNWINDVVFIARLNWRIRRTLRSPLCKQLISLLLSDTVEFVPKYDRRRTSQPSNMGYGSVQWPTSD